MSQKGKINMDEADKLKLLEEKFTDFETRIEKEIMFVNKTRSNLLLYIALTFFIEGLFTLVFTDLGS